VTGHLIVTGALGVILLCVWAALILAWLWCIDAAVPDDVSDMIDRWWWLHEVAAILIGALTIMTGIAAITDMVNFAADLWQAL